jgi:phenylalanyl-tRNA synthetase beta subunit
MQFSKAWLQIYIKEPLPSDKELVDVITFNAFEVEGTEVRGSDAIFDIKVLPNRAHDALAHRGVAKEIAALLNLTFVDPYAPYTYTEDVSVTVPNIQVEDTKACTRFVSVRIDGVAVTESPAWLKERLTSIGQKSINSVVDITNFVQFSINKPLHAYDASLVQGETLKVRFAGEGEKLVTLEDKELVLDTKTLVIADTKKPLGLAGIKGGKSSGVSSSTTSLIIESANFNSVLVRKTSQKYGIRTDASKRFENVLSDELSLEGIVLAIKLICELNPSAKVSALVDVQAKRSWDYVVSVTQREVNGLLGAGYTEEAIEDVWKRVGFSYEKMTLREKIESLLPTVANATYKNPSAIREDAPNYFSCSSLISYLFSGVWQPSISIDKYVYSHKIAKEELKWGDLIFSNTGNGSIRYGSVGFLPGTKVEEGIDHVGMYVGDGKVLHISQKENKVVTEDLVTSAGFQGNCVYGRLADMDEVRYFVSVPAERLDIRIKEDLVEEVARVEGLSSIKGVLPELKKEGKPHKRLHYENKIKKVLLGHGLSEIMTYSFGSEGEVAIVKGLASDKEKLRTNLGVGVLRAFGDNLANAPYLEIDRVGVYEFGNVFTANTETRHVAIALDDGKKKSSFKDEVDTLLKEIAVALNSASIQHTVVSTKPYLIEFDFDALIEVIPEPTSYEPLVTELKEVKYESISPYPCIVRDIACFTTSGSPLRTFSIPLCNPSHGTSLCTKNAAV